jgi:hypothetical protein
MDTSIMDGADAATRTALRALIRRIGWRPAATAVGIGYGTARRIIVGDGRVRRTTVVAVRLALTAQSECRP